jgi:hypothetical protein
MSRKISVLLRKNFHEGSRIITNPLQEVFKVTAVIVNTKYNTEGADEKIFSTPLLLRIVVAVFFTRS